MVQEKVTTSTWTLQWKCVESRTDGKRLYYGRFILSPLMKGPMEMVMKNKRYYSSKYGQMGV